MRVGRVGPVLDEAEAREVEERDGLAEGVLVGELDVEEPVVFKTPAGSVTGGERRRGPTGRKSTHSPASSSTSSPSGIGIETLLLART